MTTQTLSVLDTPPLTMSSREIAELVESRHDSVKRAIERLDEKGVITLPPLVETSFLDAAGKTQWTKEYRLGKRDSYVVVAQLSPEFTARLVDRWQELEAQADNPTTLNPSNLSRLQLIQLALEAEQELQAEKAKTAALEPKAQALKARSASPTPLRPYNCPPRSVSTCSKKNAGFTNARAGSTTSAIRTKSKPGCWSTNASPLHGRMDRKK